MESHYCPWSKTQTVRLGLALISAKSAGEYNMSEREMNIFRVFENALFVTLFVTFGRRLVPRIMLEEAR
jgi:hypothetical protein